MLSRKHSHHRNETPSRVLSSNKTKKAQKPKAPAVDDTEIPSEFTGEHQGFLKGFLFKPGTTEKRYVILKL